MGKDASEALGRQARSKLKRQLGDKFMDLMIAHGLSLEDIPEDLRGKELHIPQVNFDVPLEQQMRAKIGPPSYAVRAKYLEDMTDKLMDDLARQYRQVAESCRQHPAKFKKIWTAIVETIDLSDLNQLVNEHNTFYPIEANLQADPETGQIMMGATPWKPKKKLSAEGLLARFPADLASALGAD